MTTSGLWRHKWRPIQLCLIVYDFGVEYFGKQHADHLATILQKYHNITEYWEGKKYADIYLKWDYDKRKFRETMDVYILDLIKKLSFDTKENTILASQTPDYRLWIQTTNISTQRYYPTPR